MTIFISDCHLGNWRCQADKLLDFLHNHETEETIFLVGDIIDDHQLKKWPTNHYLALQKILEFKKIIYLPGNHDRKFRKLYGIFFGGQIAICKEYVYDCYGKSYLVTHGDRYDWLVRTTYFLSEKWIAKVFRTVFDHFHTRFSSVSSQYCRNLANIAKSRGLDGVICGHNHYPDQADIDGIHYINCGDWIESCTGVIETAGKFHIVPG
jgi:UDP-2,3-diacylglucosamine pyrophosphatase LpxH